MALSRHGAGRRVAAAAKTHAMQVSLLRAMPFRLRWYQVADADFAMRAAELTVEFDGAARRYFPSRHRCASIIYLTFPLEPLSAAGLRFFHLAYRHDLMRGGASQRRHAILASAGDDFWPLPSIPAPAARTKRRKMPATGFFISRAFHLPSPHSHERASPCVRPVAVPP